MPPKHCSLPAFGPRAMAMSQFTMPSTAAALENPNVQCHQVWCVRADARQLAPIGSRRPRMSDHKPLRFASASRNLAAAAFACVIACGGSAGLSQTGVTMIAIDKMTVGAAPARFEFARTGQGRPSQWAVVADATAA